MTAAHPLLTISFTVASLQVIHIFTQQVLCEAPAGYPALLQRLEIQWWKNKYKFNHNAERKGGYSHWSGGSGWSFYLVIFVESPGKPRALALAVSFYNKAEPQCTSCTQGLCWALQSCQREHISFSSRVGRDAVLPKIRIFLRLFPDPSIH